MSEVTITMDRESLVMLAMLACTVGINDDVPQRDELEMALQAFRYAMPKDVTSEQYERWEALGQPNHAIGVAP